jgi:predicted transcriptional regulator
MARAKQFDITLPAFRVRQELRENLQFIANVRGMSLSDIAREALWQYVNEVRKRNERDRQSFV